MLSSDRSTLAPWCILPPTTTHHTHSNTIPKIKKEEGLGAVVHTLTSTLRRQRQIYELYNLKARLDLST